MVNFGPLTAEISSGVWSTPANFNGFRVLAALLHGSQVSASAKLCGVEQRAPPTFGMATITLGIRPHSSFSRFTYGLAYIVIVFTGSAFCVLVVILVRFK